MTAPSSKLLRWAISGSVSLYVALSCGLALGQTNPDEVREFSGSVYVRPIYVDNATAVAEESEQVSELQYEYGATLASEWLREWSRLSLNYEMIETRYSDDSQPNDSRWQGRSLAALGNDSTFYELTAEHSVRRVLRSPGDAPILLANTIEREIASVSPLLRARLGSANALALQYTYLDVDFARDDSNDSTRDGVDLMLTRFVSPTRNATLIIGQREIDYLVGDDIDYEMEYIAARLDVENRTYDYSLQVGYADIVPEVGESFSSPTGELTLSSTVASSSRVTLFLERTITDSSQGNGNSSFFSSDVNFDAAVTQRDQVKRSTVGINWLYEQLCSRCELSLSLGLDRVDYVTLSANDSRQRITELALAYEVSPLLTSRFSVRTLDTDFVQPDAPSFDAGGQIAQLELRYNPQQQLEFRFMLESDRRDAQSQDSYRVNSASLSLAYIF